MGQCPVPHRLGPTSCSRSGKPARPPPPAAPAITARSARSPKSGERQQTGKVAPVRTSIHRPSPTHDNSKKRRAPWPDQLPPRPAPGRSGYRPDERRPDQRLGRTCTPVAPAPGRACTRPRLHPRRVGALAGRPPRPTLRTAGWSGPDPVAVQAPAWASRAAVERAGQAPVVPLCRPWPAQRDIGESRVSSGLYHQHRGQLEDRSPPDGRGYQQEAPAPWLARQRTWPRQSDNSKKRSRLGFRGGQAGG
jgi:hypothetical protein